MWKKTFLALATVAALAGFATVADTAPAAAQGMHRPLPHRMHGGAPHFGGMHRPPPVFRPAPMRHRHWAGPRVRIYTPPVVGFYGGYEECRIVRKRVRVLTDYGWTWRWRKVRYCD